MAIDIEELFENLSILTAEELIRVADHSSVLLQASTDDLIYLAQELAGRLEDVLNIRVDYQDEGDDDSEHGDEFNG